MRMSLGYVPICLVTDELDVKYYVTYGKMNQKEYIMVGTTIWAALIQR